MIAYIYQINDTLNNQVNIEKLDIEIRASVIPNYISIKGISNNLYIELEEVLEESNKIILDGIVNNHDGNPANVTESLVNERESKIRVMTQMAEYHPLLDNNTTTDYLTTIDNYFNGWKRSGNNTILINKILSDANDVNNDFYDYLNVIVNTEGNKTFEFLISKIT